MGDDFSDIPAFLSVVEAGGFAAAGQRLNLSRSAVGRAIARLEARLGVRLFHRTTRKQSLTEHGQSFHEHCQQALEALRTGQAVLESGQKEVAGRLRVSMPVLFGRLCVVPVLTRLVSTHPALELDLNFSDRPMDLLDDRFDLAVRNGKLGSGTGLMARRVAYEHTRVFASPDYIKRHGKPETTAELADHHAITYGRNGRVQVWQFPQHGLPPEEVIPPTRLRFDDLEAIADAAARGFGLAWLPHWLVRTRLQAGELVPTLETLRPFTSQVHIVWPKTPHLPTRVRVAIDALAAELPNITAGS